MKQFQKVISVFLCLILCFGTFGIGTQAKTARKYVKSISVSKKATITIPADKEKITKTYKIKVKVNGKASKAFTAKSSKKAVAAVKVKGNKLKVTAKKAGKATIIVTTKAKGSKGKKLRKKIKITVKKAKSYVESINIASSDTITIPADEETVAKKFQVTVKVSGNASKEFTADSSKTDVAAVSVSGDSVLVTAKKPGTANITVTTKGKDAKGKALTASLALTVTKASTPEKDYTTKQLSVLRDKLDSDESATVRYYKDQPNVPYMSVTDFYNQFELTGTELKEGISLTRSNSKYSLTTFSGDKAVFDVDADTMYFDNIDRFVTLAHDLLIEQSGGVDEDYPFIKRTNTFDPVEATPMTLSLSDYHIDLRGDETGVYVPLPTLADLFATPSNYYVVYVGGKIYVKDYYGTLQEESAIDEDPDYIPAVKADRPDDLVKYTYDELCFDVDLWYGKPGQEFIHDDLLNGKFNDVLTEKYPEIKQMLLANDFASFFTGLNNVYYGVLFDGGHTALMAPDIQMSDLDFAQNIIDELKKKEYGASYYYYANVKDEHQAQRKEVREPIYNGDYYIESGDTAMIHFDRFQVDNEGWKDFYAGKGERPLENDSFGSDSFGTVLSGLERASQNPAIKNIIIDVSCNGGGDDSALLAIEWLINGTGYVRDKNAFTNQIQKQSVEIDINFDGKFDEKDVSPYTHYNYGILTSDFSFSCGNAFPWFMHEHDAMILGQQSGGGACAIRNCPAGGIKARVSAATSTLITEDGGSVDFGCPVDADLTTDGENLYENFYDLTRISEEMNNFFAP